MEVIQNSLNIILQKNDYFRNLNQKNRELLSEICFPRQVNKRDVIFYEGEKGHALYLCARGTIQLFKTSADGQEVVIKIVGSGELFGEVVLFEKEKYPVTAAALEKSLVYVLPKAQFHCLLEIREFREEFISILMTKMRYLTEQIQFLTVHDVEERFLRFLKQRYGETELIQTKLSKKDFAAAIGTTPETLSRLILRLRKEGRIEWEGKTIRVFK